MTFELSEMIKQQAKAISELYMEGYRDGAYLANGNEQSNNDHIQDAVVIEESEEDDADRN